MRVQGFAGFKKRLRRLVRWWSLANRLKKPALLEVYTDQELIFENSGCYLSCQTRNAYVIKVYVDGRKIGAFLPGDDYWISPRPGQKIAVRVVGAFQSVRQNLNVRVTPLKYREAARPGLTGFRKTPPPVFKTLRPQVPAAKAVSPVPVIKTAGPLFSGNFTAELEAALAQAHTSN